MATAFKVTLGLVVSTAAHAAAGVSNTFTSRTVYDDILNGVVTVEIQHPTVASNTRAYSVDAGEACEFGIQIRASVRYPIIDLYVHEEYEKSIGIVRVDGDCYISTERQSGTLCISEPESSGNTADEFLIGLVWYEGVTRGQVFPVSVTWSPLQKLAKLDSKKIKLKITKVFSNWNSR